MIVLELLIISGGLLASFTTGLIIDHFVMLQRQSRPK